jgi:hypothetical protein
MGMLLTALVGPRREELAVLDWEVVGCRFGPHRSIAVFCAVSLPRFTYMTMTMTMTTTMTLSASVDPLVSIRLRDYKNSSDRQLDN